MVLYATTSKRLRRVVRRHRRQGVLTPLSAGLRTVHKFKTNDADACQFVTLPSFFDQFAVGNGLSVSKAFTGWFPSNEIVLECAKNDTIKSVDFASFGMPILNGSTLAVNSKCHYSRTRELISKVCRGRRRSVAPRGLRPL